MTHKAMLLPSEDVELPEALDTLHIITNKKIMGCGASLYCGSHEP